ncbi:MAG: citrate synthase [Planctomycetota bacterium]|nr:MAG: citrate synthase [Planctomycetota bacterium]REK27803.1 MAG: citrate synthase [Planctomycetota bacterium]REK40257.1 MAG: citrate synthase [Planctomycetota bacterium]
MTDEQLTVTDQRTGRTHELPIEAGTIPAPQLREVKTGDDDFGLMSYDPSFKNTASTRSAITFIDGDNGVLRYRGYPIEQLAEEGTFLETAYLLLFGELPDSGELDDWRMSVTQQMPVPGTIEQLMKSFRDDADPMGMFISAIAALSTLYPKAGDVRDSKARLLQIRRLIAQAATIAALVYRRHHRLPYVAPDEELSYAGNVLRMMFKKPGEPYRPEPVLERTLDMLLVLHADHEQNCSATTMRGIGSSLADPYSAVAGAAAALSGPLHGGANQAVMEMLEEIGETSRVPEFIGQVKAGEGRLMGFGHRVYRNYDPRAKIVKQVVDDVFAVTGRNRLIDVALELEKVALEDDYFVERRLYPNVDFYSGIIYQAIGFPTNMFPVLFAVARTAGWLAQWVEMLEDPEQKIARPRQIYIGPEEREYVALNER